MKGFVCVTDKDWFAWVALLKQDWRKAQGDHISLGKSEDG